MSNNDRLCNLLESCHTPEAPLCPLQEITLKKGIWYGDEPVCQCEIFQNLPWIKKQKLIAEMGLKADDGFFTIRMLDFSRIITRNLKGANPDDTNAERKWLELRKLKSDERFINRTKKSELAKNKNKLAHRKKSKTVTMPVPRKRLL